MSSYSTYEFARQTQAAVLRDAARTRLARVAKATAPSAAHGETPAPAASRHNLRRLGHTLHVSRAA